MGQLEKTVLNAVTVEVHGGSDGAVLHNGIGSRVGKVGGGAYHAPAFYNARFSGMTNSAMLLCQQYRNAAPFTSEVVGYRSFTGGTDQACIFCQHTAGICLLYTSDAADE